ncbi:MAG: OmpA family protein [Candidatus Zixiibacteriota bacterium]|nr:MAG: OmpA family protein [candidate division Zixibacteria bacterium]
MKRIAFALPLLLLVGCGVNKDYVQEQIAASEARQKAELTSLSSKADQNAAEVAKLKDLANQLQSKTDMALNEAAGFENYQIIWSGEINFDFDSYEITSTAADILNEAGQKLESAPKSLVEIIGYTDKTGPASYNLVLGEKRADAAKRFLADHFGIALYRMFTLSYGEEKPKAAADENQANSQNRRVEIRVWGPIK